MTTTTATYIVTLRSMITLQEVTHQFNSKETSQEFVQLCCDTFKIDDWNGQKGLGSKISIEVELAVI